MCLVGAGVFTFWPTAVSRPITDATQCEAYRMLIAVDGAANACPSLHATFAVFSGFCIRQTLQRLGAPHLLRILNWCWCFGIL
jgi:hypothetical protein